MTHVKAHLVALSSSLGGAAAAVVAIVVVSFTDHRRKRIFVTPRAVGLGAPPMLRVRVSICHWVRTCKFGSSQKWRSCSFFFDREQDELAQEFGDNILCVDRKNASTTGEIDNIETSVLHEVAAGLHPPREDSNGNKEHHIRTAKKTCPCPHCNPFFDNAANCECKHIAQVKDHWMQEASIMETKKKEARMTESEKRSLNEFYPGKTDKTTVKWLKNQVDSKKRKAPSNFKRDDVMNLLLDALVEKQEGGAGDNDGGDDDDDDDAELGSADDDAEDSDSDSLVDRIDDLLESDDEGSMLSESSDEDEFSEDEESEDEESDDEESDNEESDNEESDNEESDDEESDNEESDDEENKDEETDGEDDADSEEDSDEDENDDEESVGFTELTIPQLKEELRSRNLKLSGNKPDLIQRLNDFEDNRNAKKD